LYSHSSPSGTSRLEKPTKNATLQATLQTD
jgi:hypothetical protein